jgi:signal transduction histidine kinase
LRRANQELQHLNELKSSFLSNVSHELRTPLTSIKSFSEILLNYPDEDLVTRTEFLQIIRSESERLTRLINDVLDLAKIEAGRMEFKLQPVELGDLIHGASEVIRPLCEEKGLELTEFVPSGLPLVMADRDRILQVLTNLLGNALKFTKSGFIHVGARGADREVILFVSDSGPGIPPDELEIIFEKFRQRGDSLIGKPQGTGLGLAICREIMQHHNGKIWAESQEGSGATFCCSMPALARTRSEPREQPAGAAHA